MGALAPAQVETLALGLEAFAGRALARRLRRLAAAGEAIEHLDAAALHAIRLRCGPLRYVAEVFAPIYPGKATRRFMRVARLFDRLGRLNDKLRGGRVAGRDWGGCRGAGARGGAGARLPGGAWRRCAWADCAGMGAVSPAGAVLELSRGGGRGIVVRYKRWHCDRCRYGFIWCGLALGISVA